MPWTLAIFKIIRCSVLSLAVYLLFLHTLKGVGGVKCLIGSMASEQTAHNLYVGYFHFWGLSQ